MTLIGGLGCTLVAIGPCVVLFISSVARDPMKVIVMTAGAFFWLLALLFTSTFWYAFRYIIPHMAPSLVVAVAIQEAMRFGFFKLVKLAGHTLRKIPTNMNSTETDIVRAGSPVRHVNPIDNPHVDASIENTENPSCQKDVKPSSVFFDTPIIAYVGGVGFAVMSCIAQSLRILFDAYGPGIAANGWSSKTFFLTAAFQISCLSLMQICWSILLFMGFERQSYVHITTVYLIRIALSCLSLANDVGSPWPEIICAVYLCALISMVFYSKCMISGKCERSCLPRRASINSKPITS